MRTLQVTFSDEGEPKIETTGCAGQECKALTKDIEKALGTKTADTDKPEIHATNAIHRNLHN